MLHSNYKCNILQQCQHRIFFAVALLQRSNIIGCLCILQCLLFSNKDRSLIILDSIDCKMHKQPIMLRHRSAATAREYPMLALRQDALMILGGALGFHGLRVWPILALGFRDLRLNRAGFRVLRCVAGCGFDNFLCSGFGYFTQNSYFVGFLKSYNPCG